MTYPTSDLNGFAGMDDPPDNDTRQTTCGGVVFVDGSDFDKMLRAAEKAKAKAEEAGDTSDPYDAYDPANIDDDSDLHEREDWEDCSL